MAEIDDLDNWIVNNAETARGTPEFVQKAARYRELRDAETKVVDVDTELRAQREANPGGFDATMNRMFSGAVTGLPDLGIALYNAGARAVGYPNAQADYLGPKMIEAGGGGVVKDPSTMRQLLEGAGSALMGGGAGGIARSAAGGTSALNTAGRVAGATTAQVVAPTVASNYGGKAGGAIGEKLGDRETGELLGSLLGGAGASAAPGAATRYTHSRFAGQGKPNAPEIAAAAQRQNVTPTAGMLGNETIQGRERTMSGQTGARTLINDRRNDAIRQVGDAWDRTADARGATGGLPTPGTIGESITTAARETAEGLRARSDAAQARLMDRVGSQTPVPLRPVQEAGVRMQLPGSGLEPAMRANIAHRLGPAVEAMLLRRGNDINNQPLMFDAQGRPMQGNGPPRPGGQGYPDQGSVAAPYADVRAYRTELGRNVDMPTGQRLGPAAQLYEPVTTAMRGAADVQGVPRRDFDNVQAQTRDIERTPNMPGDPVGDYPALMGIASREPKAAFDYMYGGTQNPARLDMLEATQHPQVPGIMGDIMRYMGTDTVNNPNQGAPGPRQLASAVERMHPDAASTLFGPQQPAVNDIATLARAINYPTSQTGLNRAVGGQADSAVRMAVGSEALGHLGAATGIPGAATAGRLTGLGIMPLIRNLQARVLQGPTAINALGGGAPAPVMTMQDLVASINAIAQQRPGQGP